MSAGRPPLPMTTISGYLGSGKTTLLNAILARPLGQAITVLVNDFGEIAVDESLIVNRTGDKIALTNGCVCCSIGGDLFDAIDKILESDPRPDRLVIETSGVADPTKISAVAHAEPELEPGLTAVLVDCLNFRTGLDDLLLADSLLRQVRAADLLILTKTDIAPEAERDAVLEILAARAPGVPVHATGTEALGAEVLFAAGGRAPAPGGHGHGHDHHHGTEYATWSYSGPARLDPEAVRAVSDRKISGCLRLKGTVIAADGSGWVVQRAGAGFDLEPAACKVTEIVAIGLAGELNASVLANLVA
jgi:G3E family GTPase